MLELSINTGKEAEFQQLMNEMVTSTENEPGTSHYEWLRNGDAVHTYERFRNADAAMTHLKGFNEKFASRFLDTFSVNRLSVYGPVGAELRDVLSGFGGMFYDQVGGFSR